MSGSALIGNPPANQDDLGIVKGLYAQASITSANLSTAVEKQLGQ